MTDYAKTCQARIQHGVGYKKTIDACGRPATYVTIYDNGFCNRHANTKAGRAAQRQGNLVAK